MEDTRKFGNTMLLNPNALRTSIHPQSEMNQKNPGAFLGSLNKFKSAIKINVHNQMNRDKSARSISPSPLRVGK